MRPYSVNQLALRLQERGDTRSLTAINKFLIRAVNAGAFPNAYKAEPRGVTSPWLIPVEDAERWLEVERDPSI